MDRDALPDPVLVVDKSDYISPRNELEKKVRDVLSELFNLPPNKLGIEGDFFALGGDSIMAIQFVGRLRQRLNLNLTVQDIFDYNSIKELFDNKKISALKPEIKTEQVVASGEISLLPVQKWFFENNYPVLNHWNQSFMIKVCDLNVERLEEAIVKLIKYHDAFRLGYKRKNGKITQYYDDSICVEKLKRFNINSLSAEEGSKNFVDLLNAKLTEWQSNFNIERGHIYAVGYVDGYKDGSARIYFAVHHLIIDSVSWRILSEDLRDLYYGKNLSSKGSSYRQWANVVTDYKRSNISEKSYWDKFLSAAKEELPNIVFNKKLKNNAALEVEESFTKQLLKEIDKVYNTRINDILLTVLAYILYDITGNKINYVTLEGHGREEIDSSIDVSRTMGWFTTLYPVKLEVKEDFGTSIICTKEHLREIPNKGVGYGVFVGYESIPLPKIVFNYFGQFETGNNTKDIWQIVKEDAGDWVYNSNIDENIVLNALVQKGIFHLHVKGATDADTVTNFSNLFELYLKKILEHCVSQSRGYLTASDIGNIIPQAELDDVQRDKEIEGVYLINNLQYGFLYHFLNQGDVDDAYKVQNVWEYNTKIDVNKFKKAWEYAQRQFSSLRLRFSWQSALIQIIDKYSKLNWRYVDLTNNTDCENEFQSILQLDRLEPYDLKTSGLFRVYLIKQKEDLYKCIINNHHIILDGWSIPVVLDYVHTAYAKLIRGEEVRIKPDQIYKNVQNYLQDHQDQDLDHWNKYISQIEQNMDLTPLMFNRKINIDEYKYIMRCEELSFEFRGKHYDCLKQLCHKSGVTLSTIIQFVWNKVLSVYTNSIQTITGLVISGRNIPVNDVEKSVGLYINTLPLIINHENTGYKSVIELIRNLQNNINEINSKSNVGLVKLQKQASRIFNNLFVHANYPKYSNTCDVSAKFLYNIEKLDYPLTVIVTESDNAFDFKLSYAGELFDERTIQSLLTTTNQLLVQISNDPEQKAEKLNYLSQFQRKKVVNEWNDTEKQYPVEKSLHRLFEEQVDRSPDSVALVSGEKILTYSELNKQANQLANYLIENCSISLEDKVALCLDRNESILVAILAVLKSGGAYVSITSSYPDERIKYILEDTQAKIILTNEAHGGHLNEISEIDIVSIDNEVTRERISLKSTDSPSVKTSSFNLAYIIYTSGTTGKPKAVMIEHRNVVNASHAAIEHRGLDSKSNTLSTAPYVFDGFVLEVYPILFAGGALFLLEEAYRKDIKLIYKYCVSNRITNLCFTTKLAEEFLHLVDDRLYLASIIAGGEKLCTRKRPSFNVINEYGPTEATVCTTQFCLSNGEDIFIGKPILNTKCYVLSKDLGLVPVGAVGELYITGAGLGRGYLNKPDLTSQKFIANPFQLEEERNAGKNSRLYKTGDLVRMMPDGNLDHVDRGDFQVKIRGYRIELGEIESALLSYVGVKHSVVLARERDIEETTKYLVGYYVSDSELNEVDILSYLTNKLPEYMVPSILVRLEKLPLTRNGKVDRKALPEPNFFTKKRVAPRNIVEKKLCTILGSILAIDEEKISIEDDFFMIGGDSILAIKLIGRISEELDIHLQLVKIFQCRSIVNLTNLEEFKLQYNKVGTSYDF